MANLTVRLEEGHSSSVLCVDSSIGGSTIISGGEGGEICVWKRDGTLCQKLHSGEDDCTGICISQSKENTFYAALGNAVKVFDHRNLHEAQETYQFNEEEINQIVVGDKENFLAACDDSGEVKIISLLEKRLYKTLRRKHTNICSTVCFRIRKPWEIFSGGMDCNLIHWDFSRPKCLNQFNMRELQDSPSDIGGYMVNPPFVHNIAMSPDGNYLACALENGFVSIFDASKKNISEMFTLHAHTQGVSQVGFVSETKLLTGGNDCIIAAWDLAKMNGNESSHEVATNGHTSPIHVRNAQITENCKLSEVELSSKVNWMQYFSDSNNGFVILADQTPSLTILPIEI